MVGSTFGSQGSVFFAGLSMTQLSYSSTSIVVCCFVFLVDLFVVEFRPSRRLRIPRVRLLFPQVQAQVSTALLLLSMVRIICSASITYWCWHVLAPTVTSISPSAVPTAGSLVTLTGTGLTHFTNVSFSGKLCKFSVV
jgi:hypothetical protein